MSARNLVGVHGECYTRNAHQSQNGVHREAIVEPTGGDEDFQEQLAQESTKLAIESQLIAHGELSVSSLGSIWLTVAWA